MFLYYVPAATATAEQIEAAGLAYALEAGALTSRGVQSGPGGQPGRIVASAEADPAGVGYWPQRQSWRRLPGSEAWVGMEAPPQPAELVRRQPLPGHPVTMGDGQSWTVPVALAFLDGSPVRTLPSRMGYTEEGRWVRGEVEPVYARLWETAAAWLSARVDQAQHVHDHGSTRGHTHEYFDDDWLFPRAVEVLAVNYRLGPVECDLAGLLTDRAAVDVLDAAIDTPGRIALDEQKKTPDSASTPPGGPDSPPATDRPSPT